MSDRASPSLIETGLKSLIGTGRDNYPLISGTNGKESLEVCLFVNNLYFFNAQAVLAVFNRYDLHDDDGRVHCTAHAHVSILHIRRIVFNLIVNSLIAKVITVHSYMLPSNQLKSG